MLGRGKCYDKGICPVGTLRETLQRLYPFQAVCRECSNVDTYALECYRDHTLADGNYYMTKCKVGYYSKRSSSGGTYCARNGT